MRILVTVPSLEARTGGTTVKARGLVKSLNAIGHEALLAGCGHGQAEFRIRALAWFHETPLPSSFAGLKGVIREVDVVNLIGFRDPLGLLTSEYCIRAGVPFVIEPSGMIPAVERSMRLKKLMDKSFGRRLLRASAKVVANSQLEANALINHGISAAKVRVIPFGVEVDPHPPDSERMTFRQKLGLDREPLVLWIGRFSKTKGLRYLLEAVANLPACSVLLVGPDSGDGTLSEVRYLVRSLGLERRVAIIPQGLWGADKYRAFAAADLVCLPSNSENFGAVAAEAGCLGIPVVVSESCGVKEFIDPRLVRVVLPRSPESLRETIAGGLRDFGINYRDKSAAATTRETLSLPGVARARIHLYREIRKPSA